MAKTLDERVLTALFAEFNHILNKSDHQLYKKIVVRKKSRQLRTLYQPCDDLKKLQYRLLPFLKQFSVSRHVSAYERGCSIKKNAQIHSKSKHILHLDIKDFFPSITQNMFDEVFCHGLHFDLGDKLWRAVSVNGGLPIGAPTSPFIANRLLLNMDRELSKAKGFFKKYTRYADDLIFSASKRIDDSFRQEVEGIVNSYGFSVNTQKTYFMSTRKCVTGILIVNKSLSVGTTFKKRLKSSIYNYLTKNEGHRDIIKGKLAHLKFIEPHYYEVLKYKYGHMDTYKLLFTR